jgi:hypothetical protein
MEGCICLFIDALDEYSGKSEDIARFVKALIAPVDITGRQKLLIRVCASSRPWTAFTSLLSEVPSLIIQDWTIDDIRNFANDRLDGCKRECDEIELILDEITKRADGVFLWVKLVLDELWQPFCDGKSIEYVQSLLGDLPNDLPEYYKRMVENVPMDDRPTLMGMFELVLCSDYRASGINLIKFSLAIHLLQESTSIAKDISLTPANDQRRIRELERRIKACSGGLLEVTNDRVQFAHQTVKSFISDMKESSIFNGKTTQDMVLGGMERMMRLATQLIGHMGSEHMYANSFAFPLIFLQDVVLTY